MKVIREQLSQKQLETVALNIGRLCTEIHDICIPDCAEKPARLQQNYFSDMIWKHYSNIEVRLQKWNSLPTQLQDQAREYLVKTSVSNIDQLPRVFVR